MAFSFDGKYLAILTDYPTYTVYIWKWKKAKLLCSYETIGQMWGQSISNRSEGMDSGLLEGRANHVGMTGERLSLTL